MKSRRSVLAGVAILALLAATVTARADFSPFGSYWDNVARTVARHDVAHLRQLLASGSSPNQTDEQERTGLHIAAMNGYIHIAAILIKAKAKLDPVDKLGNTPLHYAAERGHPEILKLLLDLGVPVDPENRSGMTPLMIAARHGNLEIVRALLAKGANPAKTDFTGRDAIGWAAESRRPAVVEALKRAERRRHS
jgi:uncharacterized protein